jgi:hypothetical protein
MTVLGLLFIPVALVCFLWRPAYLLLLLVIASVFEAGSVLNAQLGDFEFGIAPFYLIEILIFIHLVSLAFGSEKLLPPKITPLRGIVLLLCAFGLWCFVSAFLMPKLFAGIPVSAPREMNSEDFGPLQWSLSNLAQAGYLTLNISAVVFALHQVRTHLQAEQLSRALYRAVFIVVFVGFSQFIAAEMDLDFPYEVFNNNPGYAQGTDQELGLLRRINSTFTEPSMAGSYLAAVNCGLLAAFLNGKKGTRYVLAILPVGTLLLFTTSSTGFVAFAAGASLLLAISFNPFRTRKKGRESSSASWILILTVLAVVAAVLIFTPDLLDAVMAMTVEKGESYSLWARLAIEIHSLQLFVETYGLGVGLGSNRSSGLLPTLLSTVGLVGTALFSLALYRIGRSFRAISAGNSMQVAFWMLVTLVISEIVAVPDLNRPALWAALIIVCAHLNVHFLSHPVLQTAETRVSGPRSSLRTSPNIAPAR